MWTVNFQMFKLVLEKAEEPEIKLPTSAGSWKKQESSRKISVSALLTMPKPLTVDHNKLWKILKEMGITDHLTCLLRNLYAGQEATVRTGHGTTDWFQIGKGVQHTQKQRHYFANKGLSSQGYGFSSSHVWIWELDCEESWALKNWCFWTVVLEKTLESPLDCKDSQPVHPKGDQSWVFIGRTDVEAEASILWPPDVKSWLIEKDPNAGKVWRQEDKGMTEDEMVGRHHWLNRHESEQAQSW